MIRTKLSSSSGFISLGPLNFQTVGLGKQPYRSPKVYRVSYFRSTWKNAWISAVEMQLFPFFNLPLVLRSYKFQNIIIMIVYAGHVNWATYLSISGSTLPSTSAFFFKIMFEIIERILHCSIANGFELYMGFVFKISLLLVRILSVRSRWCQVSYIWSYVVTENDRMLFIWNWLKQSRAQLKACFGNRLLVVLYPLSE